MAIYSLDGVEPVLPNEDEVFIADNAQVMGKVTVGKGVGIWFGAVLRGDNEMITLGDGSNVQENCTLHTDIGFPLDVGKGCTIGHNAILHGCTLGENTLIGMGAIVLNGAVIGKNCVIGAGALVTEGKHIPDNSLVVGSPGRVIREIDADAEQKLKNGALNYTQNARRFSKGLKRLDSSNV
jgi:carbonic anhydrase/acetyltransferase-like protein (isoleucine patch superfamily)